MTIQRKKLIEVSLPLKAINAASAKEKSIRHGHPSTLHLWWARRPLAACRAVLFAQLVDDPSAWPEEFPTEEAQARERKRLHGIIERMVPWKATHDEQVIGEARYEIARSLARERGESPPNRNDARAILAISPNMRLLSAIRSAAVARSRSRPSVWDCGRTAPISTRSRC